MRFLHLFIVFLFFVSIKVVGQSPKHSNHHKFRSFHKELEIRTKNQINDLKSGALLVRLQTKKLAINALRKNGLNEMADKIEKKQRKLNIKIIAAFKSEFTFCPTFFFYSDYSQNVREKQFDKVAFLTDSLQVDTTIKFTKTNFLTAEFGIIEPDTAKHLSYYTYEPTEDWGLTRRPNYSGGEHMGFGALLIKSNQFIQLRRPFPYYVRTLDLLPNRRTPNQAVKMMNKKLARFYLEKNIQ